VNKIVEDARQLLELAEKFQLEELEVQADGLHFRALRTPRTAPCPPAYVVAPPPSAVPQPAAAAAGPAAPEPPPSDRSPILSPMVGTFYRSSAPDKPPYVQVGDTVGPETVVCIVEAMKLMNEIKAGLHGKVVELCVANETAVKAGQALFQVSPS
jgi:acetyl-CoA carboxylase biotin carboxyl carrier protein